MADVDAKVNMSLDDIIRMEKKKKAMNNKRGGGGGNKSGNNRNNRARSSSRGRKNQQQQHRSRSQARGGGQNNYRGRSNSRHRNNQYNKRGQWRRYGQNLRGKRFSNGSLGRNSLSRSRSNVTLNRIGLRTNSRGRSTSRATYQIRRGSFNMNRSRSRSRGRFNQYDDGIGEYNDYNSDYPGDYEGGYDDPSNFLKRINSMPNLSDPGSVYSRLGYQSPAQMAYRNKVKGAKNTLLQSQHKAYRMQNALQVPNIMPPLSFNNTSPRQYNTATIRAEQLLRAQRRAAYEQKLMRINALQQRGTPEPINYLEDLNEYAQRHPAMSLYTASPTQSSTASNERRGRSPFRRTLPLKEPKLEPNYSGPLRSRSASRTRRTRSRSRSRSRARQGSGVNSISLVNDDEIEDRSFSKAMYSLSDNFGVTGRTLNDRFSGVTTRRTLNDRFSIC
ncbi:CLK4-associating serine/arginine rich protein-like isoform X1 [Trichogramma pretiosum]|uniref:CLK4-associating serine/arginine rich protein-like isoform X1 n=1 Tax=Trichogramma pretiosum TaxID=7493 RepID=UPI0006C9C112|nr:CLK4-associating serine/arginine rich protein-like isoform X1 [Trichogramma pretiosum]